MDNTIRRNEKCIIGLPRCDFVFSSTRRCFIAYGFEESPFEMREIKRLLEERNIQPVEAGGSLAPAQNAFCAKICSQIITAQFCIVLLNNEEDGEQEIPNANVNMEYGLMLGFNKYIIPFQRASQKLPFNVAGLDTVKYSNTNFERLAAAAIDQAIRDTQQDDTPTISLDQKLETFLLSKGMLIVSTDAQGERDLIRLGSPLGFLLLNDFTGMKYVYFGIFTSLRLETVVWRVNKLDEIFEGRVSSFDERITYGIATEDQVVMTKKLIKAFEIWVLITSDDDKKAVHEALAQVSLHYSIQVFSLDDVERDFTSMGESDNQ